MTEPAKAPGKPQYKTQGNINNCSYTVCPPSSHLQTHMHADSPSKEGTPLGKEGEDWGENRENR